MSPLDKAQVERMRADKELFAAKAQQVAAEDMKRYGVKLELAGHKGQALMAYRDYYILKREADHEVKKAELRLHKAMQALARLDQSRGGLTLAPSDGGELTLAHQVGGLGVCDD